MLMKAINAGKNHSHAVRDVFLNSLLASVSFAFGALDIDLISSPSAPARPGGGKHQNGSFYLQPPRLPPLQSTAAAYEQQYEDLFHRRRVCLVFLVQPLLTFS
jgi:hypothetical protein